MRSNGFIVADALFVAVVALVDAVEALACAFEVKVAMSEPSNS